MNLNVQRKGDKVLVFAPAELTKAEARSAAEQLLKWSAEPERPAPKYKKGDTFVRRDDAETTVVITAEPHWRTPGWAYFIQDGTWLWEEDFPAYYLPAPPRPTPPEDCPWEPALVRVPVQGDVWWTWEGGLANTAELPCPAMHIHGGRRWIAREKQRTAQPPAAKYGVGDCFIYALDDCRVVRITGAPTWDDSASVYRYPWICDLDGSNGSTFVVEQDVANGSWLPAPPRPAEDAVYEPTGEVRAPTEEDAWFTIQGQVVHGLGSYPYSCGGRRWIAREKQPTGEAWLNTLQAPAAFWFRGCLYTVGMHRGERVIIPADRPRDWAYSVNSTEWHELGVCFGDDLADLSAATVTMVDLGEAPR